MKYFSNFANLKGKNCLRKTIPNCNQDFFTMSLLPTMKSVLTIQKYGAVKGLSIFSKSVRNLLYKHYCLAISSLRSEKSKKFDLMPQKR